MNEMKNWMKQQQQQNMKYKNINICILEHEYFCHLYPIYIFVETNNTK